MRMSSRRGSALLIVLGMLSFMVVSAVSFSIYMRQGRAPSSYLRRNIAARNLTRAALAKAIESLDGVEMDGRLCGVYDDPYPGVGKDVPAEGFFGTFQNPQYKTDEAAKKAGNFWMNRVFMPFGPVKSEDTVTTLTLEGLAYLPPAVLNDARIGSRMTRTAQWQAFPHDAGRYAYTVVNVSDCLDIGKLRADFPRDSSSGGRISLGAMNKNAASSWENAIEKWNNFPFVSLADFSVASQDANLSPVWKCIGKGDGTHFADQGDGQMADMLFITDTWFPESVTNVVAISENDDNANVLDLSTFGQPFTQAELQKGGSIKNYDDIDQTTTAGKILTANLGPGMICLKDYLDEDSIPTSLAFPTVEVAPMIVGVGAAKELKMVIDDNGGNEVPLPVQIGNVEVTVKRTITPWKMILNGGKVAFSVAFPFKRIGATKRSKNFTCRAMMKIFLVRKADNVVSCRFASDDLHPVKDDWEKGNNPVVTFGVASVIGTVNEWPSFTGNLTDPKEAAENFRATFDFNGLKIPICNGVVQTIKVTKPDSENPDATEAARVQVVERYGEGTKLTLAGLGGSNSLRPINKDGSLLTDAKWLDGTQGKDVNNIESCKFTELPEMPADEYQLCSAIWVQVLDSEKNVVDMVPAYWRDDAEFLSYNPGTGAGGTQNRKLGVEMPLLFFKAADVIKLNDEEELKKFADIQDTAGEWGALYASDPRFNFAPENWYSKPAGETEPNKDTWVDDVQAILGGDRDNDIWMFVSDQNYLQSIGELQFLPALQRMDGNGKIEREGYELGLTADGFAARNSPNSGPNRGYFWRTYSPWGDDDQYLPYNLPYNGKSRTFVPGVGGFKVNPFSQDERIIRAALADTPFDYYVASTNMPNSRTLPLPQNFGEYAFSPESQDSGSKLTDEALDRLVQRFMDRMQAAQGAHEYKLPWDLFYDGYDGNCLVWDEKDKNLWQTDVGVTLHDVDRKFLYSYWRECFANRQQLFLVFVRAEPTAAGGGSSGANVTSQLGGRAVALVWRDPDVSRNESGQIRWDQYPRDNIRQNEDQIRNAKNDFPPHRTRVLFYHQFD